MNDLKIHSHEIRSLNGTISAAFRYLLLHFRSLMGTLSLLAFPLIIIATYASIRTTERAAAFNSLFVLRHKLKHDEVVFMVFAFVVFYAGVLFHNTIINRHLIETDKAGGARLSGGQHIFNHLRQDLAATTVNYIIACILFLLIKIGYQFIVTLSSAFILSQAGSNFSFEFALAALIVVPVITLAPLLYYLSTASLYVGQRDQLGFFQAFKKVWRYVSSDLRSFWIAAAAMLLGAGLLAKGSEYFMGFIIGYGEMITNSFAIIIYSWIGYFNAVFTFVVLVVFQIAVVFHFGSLEEKTEGNFLKEKIETTT